MTIETTLEERQAIASLKRLAKRWPKSLWLFAGGQGGLAVLKCGADGGRVHLGECGGVDPDYMIDTVDLPADGGDW